MMSMRFGILCVGSHGDILPYVALGAKLKAKGHEVCIASHKKAESFCQKYGLEFALVDGDLTELGKAQNFTDILNCSGLKKLAAFRLIMRLFKENLKQQLDSSLKAVKGVDALIYSPAAFAGPHLAEYYRMPAFLMPLQPEVRTKEYPSCIIPLPNFLGKFGHFMGHIIAEQMFWQPIRSAINRFRKKTLNIRKMHFWGPSFDPFSCKLCTLVAFSPSLMPPPKDWGSHVHMVGFSRVPSNVDTWHPPEALQSFLRGNTPVYIGFGSLSDTCPKVTVEKIVGVLKKKKIKALIQNTLPGINEMQLPDHIFLSSYIPHDWLFPRVSAIIHHGGVGTTASGLFAGKPTLVMPFLLDQFHWAKKTHEWGVGPKALPIERCNENSFESSLSQLLNNPSYQKNAAAIMNKLLKEEEGTETAYRVISDALSRVANISI